MSEQIELSAQAREDAGKGASRRLRRMGRLPGILYGGGKDPEMFSLAHNELMHEMGKEAFYSSILLLQLGGASQQVVLKGVQRHPAKPFVLHVDFQRIRAGEKIHMTVPLHFLNEDQSAGVKKGGTVFHSLTELAVACLPQDLPEAIEIDMAALDVGDLVLVRDVALPKGVGLDPGVDLDERVASVTKTEIKEPEAEEEGPQAAAEVEAGEAKP